MDNPHVIFEEGLTLDELVHILNEENCQFEAADIYIDPPDPNVLTDEDSGDEDVAYIDNLAGNQLLASAEARLFGTSNCEITQTDVRSSEDESLRQDLTENYQQDVTLNIDTYLPENNAGSKQRGESKSEDEAFVFQKPEICNFIEGDLENVDFPFPVEDFSHLNNLSEVQMFEKFFDENIFQFLCNEIEKYALFKNQANPKVTTEDLKCYIGILILSGYNEKPGKRFYWDIEEDMGNPLVKSSMRRDRFLEITKFLHCADNNNLDMTDKYNKIRPLMTQIKEKFVEHFIPQRHLNYDECMVKYFGHHSCKQFIKNKPIRFGYKAWCINLQNGYIVNFDFYAGKNKQIPHYIENYLGKSTAPFYTMLMEIPDYKRKLPYQFFFDNLFTSQNLLRFLKDSGYNGSGTIRDNRLPKNIPLTTKKSFSKDRGFYETTLDKSNGIQYIRWMDNSVITVASTSYGVYPTSNVRRFSKKDKKVLYVARPNLVGVYNKNMGGTDLGDENVNRHRIAIRGKKWWWPIFTWLIDAAVQNAWILYKISNKKCTQLEFRRKIVLTYLKRYGIPQSKPGPMKKIQPVTDLRYDQHGHFIIPTIQGSRRRCAGENCESRVRTMCIKCNIGLCITCFLPYHTTK